MPTEIKIPLSIYVHFPWCVQKCPYCDFNSHALKGSLPENEYIDALICDLKQESAQSKHRPLKSIFLGGGTPSLFSGSSIEKILNTIAKLWPLDPKLETTLEANPGTVEQQRFYDYRQAGVNRLSLGIQSFSSQQLKNLGRIHSNKEALKAINIARQAGFDNFNLDLMFGLPQQTIEDALNDLDTAIDQQPTHISWYQLTLEPNTLFYQQPPPIPHHDILWKMQQQGQALLKSKNYHHYEVSAYSFSKQLCKHNNNYWHFGDYIGVGAGAHGKITDTHYQIKRYWKHKHPKFYIKKQPAFTAEQKTISQSDLIFEFMLNALRLQKPIPLILFNERTGLNSYTINNQLHIAQQQNFLTVKQGDIHLTQKGRNFLNDVLEIFLPHKC